MLDVGATNRVSDPQVFLGWFRAGRRYLQVYMGIDEPKIGLLNIATERAYPELMMIHQALEGNDGYVGYSEPARFFAGEIDLWLMEGFIGNAFLKLTEEVLALTLTVCIEEVHDIPLAQLHLGKMAKERMSYGAYLVSPLIGLKYPVFRVHGRCNSDQIAKSFEAIKPYLLA